MLDPRNAAAPGRRTEGKREADQLSSKINAQSTCDSHAAAVFDGAYGVVVRGAKSERRHLYMTIQPAERAVKRAAARGDQADLVMVRLTVVGGAQ